MNNNIMSLLADELGQFSNQQIEKTLELLSEGNTIPFIARYRKESTGNLDEVEIKLIQDRFTYLSNLENRKEEVIRLIDEQEKLTPELKEAILACSKLQQVEDLYRPYRKKRRTKATIAKEQGLEPFADYLLELPMEGDLNQEAEKYLNDDLKTLEDVFLGVHEILAEHVGDNPEF